LRDDGNFESKRDGIENTQMELTEEGDQLSYSVYSRSMKRTEAQMNMFSGAFFEGSDDEREREWGKERERVMSESSTTFVASTNKGLRIAQRHQNQEHDPEEERQRHEEVTNPSTGRRLPGALIGDEDEEADDIVPYHLQL
jgi:hypothetical protein